MKRNDPTYKAMISRIKSGELSRKQAAEEYGINPVTLNAWIVRSKEVLPDRRSSREVIDPRLEAMGVVALTPERKQALLDAVQRVIRGGISCNQAAKNDPTITMSYLARLVRKEKERIKYS